MDSPAISLLRCVSQYPILAREEYAIFSVIVIFVGLKCQPGLRSNTHSFPPQG